MRTVLLTLTLFSCYSIVNKEIHGKWRDYFPFNLIEHPHLDMYLTAQQIIENAGYHYEDHYVTTEDGYINNIVRINAFTDLHDTKKSRPAVLLLHGLIDSSDTWIVNGEENSIGFILANAGYDVWMCNGRGNKYSLNHTSIDSGRDWNYWDNAITTDIGKYDLPAFMELVIKTSNVKDMSIIAHSQGTQLMFYNLASANSTYYS